jgi:valyl-tRNA synthetase
VSQACEVFIPLDSILDTEKEKKRIRKQIEKLSKDIDVLKKRLGNEKFVQKAPPHILAESRSSLHEQQALLSTLESSCAEYER